MVGGGRGTGKGEGKAGAQFVALLGVRGSLGLCGQGGEQVESHLIGSNFQHTCVFHINISLEPEGRKGREGGRV